jgi:hypothetical protein
MLPIFISGTVQHIVLSFVDEDGTAVTPSTGSYTIVDVYSGIVIKAATTITPSSTSYTITLSSTDTAIQNTTRLAELRVMQVSFTYGSSIIGKAQYFYQLDNTALLKGVLAQLVDSARNTARNKGANVPADGLLWDSQELIEYLDEGQDEICRRAYVLEDRSTATVCTMALTAAIAKYALHAKIIMVDTVLATWTGEPLTKQSEREMDEQLPGWRSETGEPTSYIITASNELILYPSPDIDYGDITLVVKRLPLNHLGITYPTPEINERYYEDMKLWCLYKMFSKRDTETEDGKVAMSYRQLFEASVGARPSADIERVMSVQSQNMRIKVRR